MSIQRAKDLLARLESGTEGVYLVPVKDILAWAIGAVEVLQERHDEFWGLDVRKGTHSCEDDGGPYLNECKALAEFEKLFGEEK